MKRKNKGFTLIELLAVIVILGLLMAIAIPSVTRYITESRKKTVTTTLNNYIGALVNEVNDLSYTFTGMNTIYAVPIECISLERGGTNPFGEWYQANDAYFAYVLIQYDDVNSKYVYGFTFKDSAGYGLYPITQAKINERGKQIKTGLDLNKPVSGDITSLTTLANWENSGFEVDSTTDFKVLEATSEGEIGNGETTCTLCQKGKNYAQIEEEKEQAKAKPCSGEGTDVGDVITCGSEEFYVIEENTNSLHLLTKKTLNNDLNNPVQNSTDTKIYFSKELYWEEPANEENIYIYNSQSYIYQYIDAYEKYLVSVGISSAEAKLISLEQLLDLGCEKTPNYNCNNSKYQDILSGYNWWTGSLLDYWYILVITEDGNFDDCHYASANFAIRPVVTISKSEIKFN